MIRTLRSVLGCLTLLAVGVVNPGWAAPAVTGEEPVIGGPCGGCEDVFRGIPKVIAHASRIAPRGEPGEPMAIQGVVTETDGKPAAGVVVYAYHTNREGIYPRTGSLHDQPHGRLRGWARTDSLGRYQFETIRPGAYPGGSVPQHIHMHIIEPGRCTYYIDDIKFTDDPLLGSLEPDPGARGGWGVVTPTRDASGVWQVRRDIVLGQGISGYRFDVARPR